jgi:hypothetical protein
MGAMDTNRRTPGTSVAKVVVVAWSSIRAKVRE